MFRFPWSRSSSPKLKRRPYSAASLKALEDMENAEYRYEELAGEVNNIENCWKLQDASRFPILKGMLAKLYGEIDRFQQQRVDTISSADLSSGREQVKSRRKLLTNKLEVLQGRTEFLLGAVSS